MADPRFFQRSPSKTLAEIAGIAEAQIYNDHDADYEVKDVAPLDRAGEHELSFLDNPRYQDLFGESAAAVCIVKSKYITFAPQAMRLLVSDDPYRAYARVAQYFYPYVPLSSNISSQAQIDETATIGDDCAIASGVVIGKDVVIGARCTIGANTVIHDGVTIGDDTRIGALCSLSHAVIGSHVVMHRGVHVGQDGFGFSMGKDGHVKVPQLGRVVIANYVDIGAGTCIDRGTGPDTMIGAGTKIDNLVQIGHNVQIGEHVVIVSQTGIAGSTKIGDFSILGGQVGIAGHLRIGPGVKLAAQSGVVGNIPAGQTYGGTPAMPIKDWHRQSVTLSKLIKKQATTKEQPDI